MSNNSLSRGRLITLPRSARRVFLWCGNGRILRPVINNKNASPIRRFDQVFLYSMVFYVNIWTGMASNNTISWSATYDSTAQYWRISAVNTDLHRRFMFMSARLDDIFLLKSDGGTSQNMRFNVFVILVCSIYDENNLWHVKSWRFILTVEVVSKTALPRRCLVVRLSRLIYADYMQDR